MNKSGKSSRGRKGLALNKSSSHWMTGWDIRYLSSLLDKEGVAFAGLTVSESAEVLTAYDIVKWMRDPRSSISVSDVQKKIAEEENLAPGNVVELFHLIGDRIDIRRLDGPHSGFYRLKTYRDGKEQGSWRTVFRIMEESKSNKRWVTPDLSTQAGWHQYIEVVLVSKRSDSTYKKELSEAKRLLK